jgi:hypothetical protein
LVARFDNPLHRVGLRLQDLSALIVGRTHVTGASYAPLRSNPVWEFLNHHVRAKNSSTVSIEWPEAMASRYCRARLTFDDEISEAHRNFPRLVNQLCINTERASVHVLYFRPVSLKHGTPQTDR